MSKQTHEQIQGEVLTKQKTIQELEAELAKAKEENAKLKEQAGVIFKVSRKTQPDGRETATVTAYFPGVRFPTTMYAPQWLTICDNVENLRAFIEANREELTMDKPKRSAAQEQGKVQVS